ncbi:MAG: peptide deformylase [Clostridiales bacterium]|nr:peptide deformylase [Clostridiales bacterium]
MALRTIRLETDPLLRKKSKVIKKIDEKLLVLLDDMRETLRNVNGLGLAAPQIGSLKRVVIIEMEDRLYELINPEIVETKGTQRRKEGCLSVPGRNGIVERPMYVKIKALNRAGEEQIVEGEELMAVALSHELDHLDGVLYTDKAEEMFTLTAEDVEYEEEEVN